MDEKIVEKFIKKFYLTESNILLFGSFTKSKTFSDIDLLILSETSVVFSREKINFNNITFEVLVLPKKNIFEIIEKDKINGIYIEIFKEGVIIIDHDNLISNIKNDITKKNIKRSSLLKKNYLENKIQECLKLLNKDNKLFYNEMIFG